MFVHNTTEAQIGPITHNGYEYIVHKGVNAIENEVGKWLVENFRDRSTSVRQTDGTIVLTGAPVPAVLESTKEDWDGKTYATVARFKIGAEQIRSRADLLRLARDRGVSDTRLREFERNEGDTGIRNEEIVREINNLPVPEDIRLPE